MPHAANELWFPEDSRFGKFAATRRENLTISQYLNISCLIITTKIINSLENTK